ncbi:hypothetical protein QSG27_05795, partial [Azospirillum sp. C340-1]|nr:hypothetical protein [Azospirillum isscasi]
VRQVAGPPDAAQHVLQLVRLLGGPPAEFVPATDRDAPKATAARTGRAPSRTVETLVAEAMLPPNAVGKGERVVIRFVSQRSGGCGSLEGRDRVCVALAGGTGAGL